MRSSQLTTLAVLGIFGAGSANAGLQQYQLRAHIDPKILRETGITSFVGNQAVLKDLTTDQGEVMVDSFQSHRRGARITVDNISYSSRSDVTQIELEIHDSTPIANVADRVASLEFRPEVNYTVQQLYVSPNRFIQIQGEDENVMALVYDRSDIGKESVAPVKRYTFEEFQIRKNDILKGAVEAYCIEGNRSASSTQFQQSCQSN